MPKFPTDPPALLPYPFINRETGRVMTIDPNTANDDIVDMTANLMAKWSGSALDYQDCSAAYTIVAGRPSIIINATGTGPYDITVPDSYTPAAGDVVAGVDRGGFQISIINKSGDTLTLVMDGGSTTIDTPTVDDGALGHWYYDAVANRLVNIPAGSAGGGGGGGTSTLFDGVLGSNARDFVCVLSESVQRVAFSGMIKLASGATPNINGPFINGNFDLADYKNVGFTNNGSALTPVTTDPVLGVSVGNWGPIWGYIERFADGIFIKTEWVDHDADDTYVQRNFSTFYETTIPATIDSISFRAADASGTIDGISQFRAWKDVGVGGGGSSSGPFFAMAKFENFSPLVMDSEVGLTVARNSAGNYTATFDVAQPDANYVVLDCGPAFSGSAQNYSMTTTNFTTTDFDILVESSTGIEADTLGQYINIAVMRSDWDGTYSGGDPIVSSFPVASLPPPTLGRLIIVPDEAGGETLAWANGTNFKRTVDNAIVS